MNMTINRAKCNHTR